MSNGANGGSFWKWATGVVTALLLAALGGLGTMMNHVSETGHPLLVQKAEALERQHERDMEAVDRDQARIERRLDSVDSKLDDVLKELRDR